MAELVRYCACFKNEPPGNILTGYAWLILLYQRAPSTYIILLQLCVELYDFLGHLSEFLIDLKAISKYKCSKYEAICK